MNGQKTQLANDSPASDNPANNQPADSRFTCREGGLWFDGGNGEPQRIADAFNVAGLAYDEAGDPHYILDHQGNYFALPWTEIGERTGWKIMRRHIQRMPTNRRNQERLAEYLQSQPVTCRWTLTDTAGWHGKAYILPNGEVLGSGEKTLFQNPSNQHNAFEPVGTLADWQREIGQYVAGNSRLALFVGAAFAAPLLKHFHVEGGILHLYGQSSSGKSTAQRVALSVWGHGRDAGHSWNATGHALTNAAASRNDGLLSLDEIGEDGKQAVETCAYSIANGRARLQGAKEGGNRPDIRFRVLAISSGEISLQHHFSNNGREMMAGQMVRCPSIPHVLEEKHGFADFRAFVEHLNDASITTYGTAGRAFIAKLMEDPAKHLKTAEKRFNTVLGEIHARHDDMSAQQSRTAKLFARCAAALMLASEWAISGITAEQARQGVLQCFADWLALQPKGDIEDARIREAVEGFTRFLGLFVDLETSQPHYMPGWVGFLRKGVMEEPDLYHLLPKTFVEHFCQGDKTRIARACQVLGEELDWLLKPNPKRWQNQIRVKGDVMRVYTFTGIQPQTNEADDPE